MKKRVMMLLLATVLGIGATACGSDKDSQDKSEFVMDESKKKADTETSEDSEAATDESTETTENADASSEEASAENSKNSEDAENAESESTTETDALDETETAETLDGIWETYLASSDKDAIGMDDENGNPYTIIYKGQFADDTFTAYGSMGYRSDYDSDSTYITDEEPHVFKLSEDAVYNNTKGQKVTKEEFAELFNEGMSKKYHLGMLVKEGMVSHFFLDEVNFAPNLTSEQAATDMRDFFFPEGEGEYNYDVYNLMLEDDESVKVKVEKKETYSEGDVYTITLLRDECPGSTDVDGSDRFRLGYYYVTEGSIYYLRDIVDETPAEEGFLENGVVVCAPEDDESTVDTFELRIEHDGDICRYRCWDTAVETGWYCRMEWTKGVGLTYYRSGYGAEAEPIEIALEGVEVDRES
ncbi:MAG: hypothetical protein K6E70_08670 [Butyrivibrio sp.]|nr:hypothetical protein [Butyrivibrio sp.]